MLTQPFAAKFATLTVLCALAASGLTACKLNSSGAKSDGAATMSKEDFVAACQKRLSDPAEGQPMAQFMQKFINTTDCAAAYAAAQAVTSSH